MSDEIDVIYSVLRHELGNSVNSLSITLEVLLKNFDLFNEETKIEFIRRSFDQVNRQCRLLENMRVYESADIREVSYVGIQQFLREWLGGFMRDEPESTVKIRSIYEGGDINVAVDPDALSTVLSNIVRNSVEALEGESHPEITLSCRSDLNEAEVVILDNGRGIQASILPKVTAPLFTTRENRMGLGLSVAKKMITRMRGSLEIESDIQSGTSVRIRLPLAGDPDCGIRKRNSTEREGNLKGKERILFVDDEVVFGSAFSRLLGSLGYTVTVAAESHEALRLFENDPSLFDIVITDQAMRGMTGKELAEKILAIRPEIPVILCTGYSDQVDRADAFAAGIRDFIMKPFKIRELCHSIRKLMDAS